MVVLCFPPKKRVENEISTTSKLILSTVRDQDPFTHGPFARSHASKLRIKGLQDTQMQYITPESRPPPCHNKSGARSMMHIRDSTYDTMWGICMSGINKHESTSGTTDRQFFVFLTLKKTTRAAEIHKITVKEMKL